MIMEDREASGCLHSLKNPRAPQRGETFAQEVHYQAEEKRPLGYDKSLEDAKEIISILSYPVIIPNGKGPTQDILK